MYMYVYVCVAWNRNAKFLLFLDDYCMQYYMHVLYHCTRYMYMYMYEAQKVDLNPPNYIVIVANEITFHVHAHDIVYFSLSERSPMYYCEGVPVQCHV